MLPLPIQIAAATVQAGGVIAYPTEGVFGLGCHPFDEAAVRRVLTIKRRPVEKGVILIGENLSQLKPYLAPLSDNQQQRMLDSWPGPTTWVVPHNGNLPFWVTGGRATVAVRVSGHPLARTLCKASGVPLVSTSANRSGKPSLTTALQVRTALSGEIDWLVQGRVQQPGQASQIIDLASGQQFRS